VSVGPSVAPSAFSFSPAGPCWEDRFYPAKLLFATSSLFFGFMLSLSEWAAVAVQKRTEVQPGRGGAMRQRVDRLDMVCVCLCGMQRVYWRGGPFLKDISLPL
jgi:hypothetical protein